MQFLRPCHLLTLIVTAFSISCVASASITAARTRADALNLRKVYVILDRGGLDKDYAEDLATALSREFQVRGALLRTRIPSGLELDGSELKRDVDSFTPDGILAVSIAGGVKRGEAATQIRYEVVLFVPSNKSPIWIAHVKASEGAWQGVSASRTAEAIVGQLDSDHFFAGGARVEAPR